MPFIMTIILSDKQSVQVRALDLLGLKEILFLQTGKVYTLRGDVSIAQLERMKDNGDELDVTYLMRG